MGSPAAAHGYAAHDRRGDREHIILGAHGGNAALRLYREEDAADTGAQTGEHESHYLRFLDVTSISQVARSLAPVARTV